MTIFKKKNSAGRDDMFADLDASGRVRHGRTVSLEDAVGAMDPRTDQIKSLKRDLSEAHSRIELYKFQIKGLRQDMEQLKMDAVLSGLGGYPLAAVHAYGDREAEPESHDLDPEIFFAPDSADPADPALGTLADCVARGARDAAASAPVRTALDVPALQQNLLAALESIVTQDAEIRSLRAVVQNRDIQIELLKDRVDIEQQKVHDDYVPRRDFDTLAQRAEAIDAERRVLASQARALEDAEKQLADLREAEAEAEELAESLREKIEAAAQENVVLRERYEALKQEALDREDPLNREIRALKRQVTQARQEIEDLRAAGDRRLTLAQQRMRDEYVEMQGLMQEYDEAMASLREDVDRLKLENQSLRAKNSDLAARAQKAAAPQPAPPAPDFDDAKKSLLRAFETSGSPATLLDLRRLFLRTRNYADAVRTFRHLLVDPKNQKLMPAVCLLVGEFYNLAGRKEEAGFYLANPLIRDDSCAQFLLRKIQAAADRKPAADVKPAVGGE